MELRYTVREKEGNMMNKSIAKALAILTMLSDKDGEPVKVSVLSESLGINKATCSRILGTMTNEGFTERVSRSAGYTLGPNAYCLSRYSKYGGDLIAVCHPIMNYLYKSIGCAVTLAVIRNNTKYIIDHIDKNNSIFIENFHISKDDLFTATGFTLLSNLPKSELKDLYDNAPDRSKMTYNEMLFELSSIRPNDTLIIPTHYPDYGVVITDCSSPLYQNGICVGALGLAFRRDENEYDADPGYDETLRKMLRQAATEITRRLALTAPLV